MLNAVLMRKLSWGKKGTKPEAVIREEVVQRARQPEISPKLIQQNTQNVTGLHDGVWGNFKNIRGDVSKLRGNVSGLQGFVSNLSGLATDILGDVSFLCGDIVEAVNRLHHGSGFNR